MVSASRTVQLLFAVDMRLMQRSYMRWRALSQSRSLQLPVTPTRHSSPASEVMSPLSDSLNSRTPTGGIGDESTDDFNYSDEEPLTPMRFDGLSVKDEEDFSSSLGPLPRGPLPSTCRREEVSHFRRLLWAHLRSNVDSAEAWQQGRESVLLQSQKSVSVFLLRRLQSKKLWTAYSHWKQVAGAETRAIHHKRSSQTKACLSTANILKSFANVKLFKAFRTWLGFLTCLDKLKHATERRSAEVSIGLRVAARFTRRLQRNQLQQAMAKWRTAATCVRHTERQWRSSLQSISMMLGRGSSEKLRRCFMNWRVYSKYCEVEVRHRTKAMKRALNIAYNINTHRAFYQWRGRVQLLAANVNTLRRAALHLTHSTLALHFRYWVKVDEAVRFRDQTAEGVKQVACKVVAKMANALLSKGFVQWRDQVHLLLV